MQLHKIISLLLLGATLSDVVYAHNKHIEHQQLQHIEQSTAFNMFQNFREPKKIVFSSLMGGSSHNHWVISILNELNMRGHDTSYITMNDHTKFTKNYPNIKTITIGETTIQDHNGLMLQVQNVPQLDLKVIMAQNLGGSFKDEYLKIHEIMKDEKYDVVICDHFNSPCQEAAYKLKIPAIITSSMPQSSDASAVYINNDMMVMDVPTTQFMNVWERFTAKFIKPLEFYWKMASFGSRQSKVYKSLGLEVSSKPEAKWEHSVKMFNTAFGFQQGRPLGPLVEFVGPIVKTQIPKLTPELQYFLDNHKNVAYVGFGQHVIMDKDDVSLILHGLLEAYEEEEIDGVIWAARDSDEIFPDSLVSRSNTTYNVKSFFDFKNHSDFVVLGWAPQMAILNHPSVSMVIHHGGSASLYESLYSGVRMVLYPFFADQPAAAITAEKNGYALKLERKSPQDKVNAIISKVARDEDKKLQKNVNRFKALVQIRSKHGVIKGADLVEEVLFLNENGRITHRRDVKHDLSYIKANDLDLYAIISVITIAIGIFISSSVRSILTSKALLSASQKHKLL